MTSLTIYLPDDLAEKAKKIGLLDSEKMIELLEQAIKQQETSLSQFIQSLPAATSYDQDPLDIQKEMRDEW